jgi:DNA-binding MarR family transcriptional regulator
MIYDAGLPTHCTNAKVRQLMRRLDQHYDTEVAQSGLRTTQYSLLSHVERLGPVRPVDLARGMRMTASTLSRNLQPLVAAGFLVVNSGADARSHLVEITEAGRTKRRESQKHWKLAQKQLVDKLGAERVNALHTLVDEALALLAAEALVEEDS